MSVFLLFLYIDNSLMTVFLAASVDWNHAAMNIITIFFSSQFTDSVLISTISNFKNSRGIFLKSLNSSDFLLQNRIIWALSLPFHNNVHNMDILNIFFASEKGMLLYSICEVSEGISWRILNLQPQV